MLTTGTDNITGTTGNDTINATGTTLTALDVINGGAGTDTLKVVDAAGVMNTTIPAGLNITNVEKMEIQTSGNLGRTAGEGTTESAMVQFQDLAQGLTLNLGGRVITATNGTATAADIATAFTSGTTTNNAHVSGTLAGWTVAAGGSTQQAKFTSTTADTNVSDLVATGFAVTGKPAVNQASTVQVTTATTNTADTISFVYNGVNLTTAQTGDTTVDAAATAIAHAINNYAAQTIATPSAGTVTISSPFVVSLANFAGTGATFGAFTTTQAYKAAVPAAAPTLVITQGAAPSTTAAAYDVSGIASLTDVIVTGVDGMGLKAAATQNVTVSGAKGTINVDGGKDVTVTDATAGKAITVGNGAAGGDAAGKITITDTNNTGAGNTINVEGGTDVTITATSKATNGAITVGNATNGMATGDVKITQNLNSDGVVANITGAAITVVGGKTVDVTVNANSAAKAFDSDNDISTGLITVTADNTTTDVTVTQNANVTTVTKAAVAEVKASQTVTFKDLASGKSVTVNGLVFTAEKNLTAAEVAKAFANLTATDTQSEGGISTNGIYTDANGTGGVAGWTSGAANGATVTFTGAAHNTAEFTVTSDATASVPTKAYTAGTNAAAEDESGNAVTLGNVVIDENSAVATTKSIQNITVNGATNVTLGGANATTSLDAIKTLSLANVTGATALRTEATALALTLNKVAAVNGTAVALNVDTGTASIADLDITTTGGESNLTLTAAAVKNLTIDAGAKLTISGVSATNVLESVTVKGTAAVSLGTIVDSTNLQSFNASANTGGVTATIDASTAASKAALETFVFSEGNDVVTLDNVAINKKINLGAGDDKITLAAGTTSLTGTIDGGTGTNTIAMTAAQAVTATTTDVFASKIANFQKLSIGSTGTTASAINLANLDNIAYVISAGTGNGGTLALNNMANNGTLELTAATHANGDVTVTMTDATGDADVFNIVTKVVSADIAFEGDIVVADVETINITASDTEMDDGDNGVDGDEPVDAVETATLIVTADAAKTVNVTGNSNLELTLTGSTAVTLIDGSTMTGALTATTEVSTSAATIKGGSGDDTLTADTNGDVLMGGAGKDTLSVADNANLVQLHGGAGKDTYQIGTTFNVASFATINGTAAELSGDVIKFGEDGSTAITGFNNEKLVLDAGVASYESYMFAATSQTTGGTVSYFQWAGNTYLVQDNDNTANGTFVSGTDIVVKIAGLVDFTFNDTTKVLEIA